MGISRYRAPVHDRSSCNNWQHPSADRSSPHCCQVAAVKRSRHAATELGSPGWAAIIAGDGHEAAGPISTALCGVQLGLTHLPLDASALHKTGHLHAEGCGELWKRTVRRQWHGSKQRLSSCTARYTQRDQKRSTTCQASTPRSAPPLTWRLSAARWGWELRGTAAGPPADRHCVPEPPGRTAPCRWR